eukprot:329118-Hanusia_phi.AAC.1
MKPCRRRRKLDVAEQCVCQNQHVSELRNRSDRRGLSLRVRGAGLNRELAKRAGPAGQRLPGPRSDHPVAAARGSEAH